MKPERDLALTGHIRSTCSVGSRPPAGSKSSKPCRTGNSIREVESRDFKLDSFKWLKDESVEDAGALPPPEELTTEAISELERTVES